MTLIWMFKISKYYFKASSTSNFEINSMFFCIGIMI